MKPSWSQSPEQAKILVYDKTYGWIFGSYPDAESRKDGCWTGIGANGRWYVSNNPILDPTVTDIAATLEKRPQTTYSLCILFQNQRFYIDEVIIDPDQWLTDLFDKDKYATFIQLPLQLNEWLYLSRSQLSNCGFIFSKKGA